MPDSDVTPQILCEAQLADRLAFNGGEEAGGGLRRFGGFGQLLVFGFDYMENPEAWHASHGLLMHSVMPKVQHLVAK